MIARALIYFAYSLKRNKRYTQNKQFFFNVLENPDSRLKSYFDIFMICVVMLSVFLLVYSVNHPVNKISERFESGVIVIFIAEYLLRAWLYSDIHLMIIRLHEKADYLNVPFSILSLLRQVIRSKMSYIFSFFSLIDLLAILPSYRPLRIIRVLLIFRLFKLFRYSNNIKIFSDVIRNKRFELITLATFMGFLVFIASVTIFLFENKGEGGQIRHLYDAFYWSIITLSTVGYGDITPQTVGGRLVTVSLILTGLGTLSFFTSIIVADFNDKMDTLRENRTYAELNRFKRYIIICGFGRIGQEVAFQLTKHKQPFVIIDTDESRISLAKRKKYLAIKNDASVNSVLIHAGINKSATAVLCTTGSDVANVYITLTSRYLNADIKIISRANRPDTVKKLYQAGAHDVVQPCKITGLLAAEYIGQPVAFEAILGILQGQKEVVMDTVTITLNSALVNQCIGSLDFKQRKLVLMGVISSTSKPPSYRQCYPIKHQHFYFNPEDHFELQEQDILIVLGKKYSIEYFQDQVKQQSLKP